MEKKPGGIALLVGGALMAVGSVMTWLTASVDLTALAAAVKQQIGVDISNAPGFTSVQHTFSAAGTRGWEGKVALIVGIAALAIGIGVVVAMLSGAVASRVALATGAVGVIVALEALLTKSSGVENAKAASAGQLAGSGLTPSVFDNAFKVSVGIGLYVTIVGGIVAIIAGVMLMGKDAHPVMATGLGETPPMAGSGFGGPSATPAPPVPPSQVSSPPTAPPMGQVPEPPSSPGDGGSDPSD
jgi:hypothetical protein